MQFEIGAESGGRIEKIQFGMGELIKKKPEQSSTLLSCGLI